MPHVSNLVKVTRDNQYVMATGLYKPRLKVFDTEQMSMKYEKCMDSHAIQFCNLESDYTKVRQSPVFARLDDEANSFRLIRISVSQNLPESNKSS